MLTPRGIGLLAGGVACLVAGRLLGIAALDVLAVGAGGLVLVAVLLVARRPPLQVQRPDGVPVVEHGGAIDVRLHLQNVGRLSSGPIHLADATPPELHTGATASLRGLDPGQQVPLSYRAVGRARGRHAFGPLRATIADPMTIARRNVDLPGTSQVVVLPRHVDLPDGPVPVAGRVPGDQGAGTPRPTGDDVGMIREYVVGDDLRRIHWPATAHRGSLMVRQPESRQRRRGVVLVDRRDAPSFERVVEVAASVGWSWHDRGAAVQVVDDASELRGAALPWEVQLERLAVLDADPGFDLQSLTALLAGGAAGSGTLVVVTGHPHGLPDVLQRLGRTFDRRIVVLVERGAPTPARDAAAEAARSLHWTVARVRSLEDLPAAWADAGRTLRTAA